MLKEAKYICSGNSKEIKHNKIVYLIIDGACYFSGTTRSGRSTINAAEKVVEAISAQEGIKYTNLRWFDLQTHRGYSSKNLGEYELDELVLTIRGRGPTLFVENFNPIKEVPQKVLEYFGEYINQIS